MTNNQPKPDAIGNYNQVRLGPSTKILMCKYGCGQAYVVTTMRTEPIGCLDCAINAARENMTQLKAKSGPYYDKWVARMAGWAASLRA